MAPKANALRFDQGEASAFNKPNILDVPPKRSGRGGELDIDGLLQTEETFGSSDLAGVELLQYLSSWQFVEWSKTSTSSTLSTSPARPEKVLDKETGSSFLHIENQLETALEADPIEDGYSHPAEALLEKVLRDFGCHAGNWLISLLSSDSWSASFKSGLLRLLSRQKPLTERWRYRAIQLGLSSAIIELRDAAVQAAESWDDASVIQLLQTHRESCSWLADYISRIIQETQ